MRRKKVHPKHALNQFPHTAQLAERSRQIGFTCQGRLKSDSHWLRLPFQTAFASIALNLHTFAYHAFISIEF